MCSNGCQKPTIAKGLCRSCYRKQWHLDNHEKENKANREWKEKNKKKYKASQQAYKPIAQQKDKARYERNKESILTNLKLDYHTNKEKYKTKSKLYRQKNLNKILARNRKRKELLRQRMPKWLTNNQIKQIESFYLNRPQGFHVDHIIPLRGKNVSGLHVSWNLQYLPAEENIRKGNKYESD